MKNLSCFLFSALVIGLVSCKNPDSENKILKTADPLSKEYKNELYRMIKTNQFKNISYTFQDYKIVGNQEYIVVNIKGSNLQAKSILSISNWDNISAIKGSKGIGYRGAELKNVKLSISSDSKATFNLDYVDEIID